MECLNCHAEVSEHARFCSQCGAALVHNCPSCGSSEASGAKVCSRCGVVLSAASNVARTQTLPDPGVAERGHLTVMFCDLVGSTALSVHLDVEDLHEVIAAYHKRAAEVVTRFGGFAARRVGDGVLVYFGYPRAHEDDPERAVRAGLALIEEIGQLESPEPLQVRLGIATGLVVVGDLVGSGGANENEVVGAVPNLAARLLSLAEPNTVVISDTTRQLIGSVFALEDLGFKELKGFTEPQRVWSVLGENRFKSRFEALRSAETPFVDRQEETELLLRRWTQAKAGQGRAILFSGEAGIGKSRLILALRDLLGSEHFTDLHFFCSPHHQNSTLFPIINFLERAAGFGREDTPAAKLDQLEALMAGTSAAQQDVALLADLLLLPTDRYAALERNPQRRRQQTFAALLRQITDLASERPILVIFEDIHWIDPTTQELLDIFIQQIQDMPVLLIATFRPDFSASWVDQPHVTMVTLNRLNKFDSEALVRGLAAKTTALPSDLIGEIVERADGVPLFLEEVTKTVVDAKPVDMPSAHWSLSVPPTLHASLIARLDRIGPVAKEIAQIGAAIGREFSYELAAKVADRPEPELNQTLGRLVEAGLIFQRGAIPRSNFLFKHGLLQDAAYSTLLRDRRRRLHARIAGAIEETFPELAESQPEVIARHRTEAGSRKQAAIYWQRAGELALRRSAGSEALKHFSSALGLLEGMPDATERWRQELDVRLGLGTALIIARGFRTAGHEIVDHYARAVTLGRGLGGTDRKLFRAMWGNWYTKIITGQTEQALGMANELVILAEQLADRDLLLEAYHSRWANSHVLGLNSSVIADIERGLQIYDAERHHAHAYDYGGHDTGVCAYAHGAVTRWVMGFPEKAIEMAESALELGYRLRHPPSLAHAAWWSAALRQLLRDPKPCREYAELTIRIGREQGSNMFVVCPLLLGWCIFESGQTSEGLERMEDAVGATRQSVRRFYYDYELLVFAESLLKADEPVRARQVVQEAFDTMATSRGRLFEAEAYRLSGACLAYQKDHAEAERLLLRAIDTAEQQGAPAFKLRAGMTLARLWRDQKRMEAAHDLLWQIYDQFEEGRGTSDLREAKALLNELR
ncbi:adenylate/guanylate cyclase domain-containing protein [Bradyrhizobium sp.]|uniref:adenylate/guanylate cyclase domain-containing protein n=1 Tax=Bradyrhizobium sp. TaxID=376 RepID=UPI0026196EEB|nr:adenylate/guanylate cyclase domain-containing protein [Bradyrhizobium sp.]